MLSKLKKLFSRGDRDPELAAPLFDDEDLSWLNPPEDPLDVAGWDQYWVEQIRHGLGPRLYDMMCDDRDLVRVMNAEGMENVLCAGNGMSQEPRALSEAGFHVVALDLSPRAAEIARGVDFPPETFETFCEPGMRRPGGHVEFVVGDFLDAEVCPGPFDVIIERRTAQLFANSDIGEVLGALAKRLNQDGIFLSHCHDGGWRPPAEPRHHTTAWFEENQWTIWNGGPDGKPCGQVAWPIISTG